MKIVPLGLLLVAGSLVFGQDPSETFDKAPGPIDEALRARVEKFYASFMAGKFKDAYLLVADDSEDAFIESDKNTYKDCETIKIAYSENFTTAKVIESCLGEMRFHGSVIETRVPLQTNWKVVDGKWFWTYVKPTRAETPFSPTGWVNLPKEDGKPAGKPAIPQDPMAAARNILGLVKADKSEIHLLGYETSKDELHVRNDMEGGVMVTLDKITQPGVKATIAKPNLGPHEETSILFEYIVDDAAITCGECAKRLKGSLTAQIRIVPSGQVFPIRVSFGIPPEVQKQFPPEIQQQFEKKKQ